MLWRLLDQYGVDPVRFGDWTYPQLVAVFTRGKPEGLQAEVDKARKAIADVKSGKLKW